MPTRKQDVNCVKLEAMVPDWVMTGVQAEATYCGVTVDMYVRFVLGKEVTKTQC